MRLLLALAAGLLGLAHARSAAGDRLLALLPSLDAADRYSLFLESLADRGFDVAVRAADNASVALHIDDERVYDHAVLLAPAARKLADSALLRFVDDGGNLLVAVDSSMTEIYRRLAAQFGVKFDKRDTRVVDHVHGLNSSAHAVVPSTQLARNPAIFSQTDGTAPVYFKGVGHRYSADNPLLIPLLTGARSTYSASEAPKKKTDDVVLSGLSLGLVSAFQTRANARLVFSGSTELFANTLMGKKRAANSPFAADVSQWVFQEKAVLRESAHRHFLAATGERPENYRVANDIIYEVDLSVYYDDAWHPYIADDVQFEAIMLDPYIRTTLNHTGDGSTYRGHIKLPDRYGTFTFRVNYKRPGYSFVDIKDIVAIWPLRHDEYPRFLTAAYPYYASSFVMVIGFLSLCAVWLWNVEPHGKAALAKKKA
ncbi:oligosaccharyl transferase glycoprotein complex, beta subunit [Coemansia sp. RSA 552]|nr:oligosaccharyl transferase glycoprotein complex, beta subunit [Coemansia sp. RSA 552]